MSFQNQVNTQPAPAVEGDFASSNPRATMLAGAGALVTGLLGAIVGRFAWATPAGIVNNFGSAGARIGFVHRAQQALITAFLGESGMTIPAGLYVTLFTSGDFWGRFAGGATAGQKVYANYADGSLSAAATGSPTNGGVMTASAGATFTASGSGTNLTTSAQTGVIHIGAVVAGVGIPVGTTIVSQTSGTTGAAGVYVTSGATTISAAAGTATSNILDVTAVTSGSFAVGDPISGASITSGSYITALGTGTVGGVGTYTMSAASQAASTAVTAVQTVETSYFVATTAGAGELAKISIEG